MSPFSSDTKIESFMQELKKEVELLGKMTRFMDACLKAHTRLVVIVDGLDSCEQEKLLQVTEADARFLKGYEEWWTSIYRLDPFDENKKPNKQKHQLLPLSAQVTMTQNALPVLGLCTNKVLHT